MSQQEYSDTYEIENYITNSKTNYSDLFDNTRGHRIYDGAHPCDDWRSDHGMMDCLGIPRRSYWFGYFIFKQFDIGHFSRTELYLKDKTKIKVHQLVFTYFVFVANCIISILHNSIANLIDIFLFWFFCSDKHFATLLLSWLDSSTCPTTPAWQKG